MCVSLLLLWARLLVCVAAAAVSFRGRATASERPHTQPLAFVSTLRPPLFLLLLWQTTRKTFCLYLVCIYTKGSGYWSSEVTHIHKSNHIIIYRTHARRRRGRRRRRSGRSKRRGVSQPPSHEKERGIQCLIIQARA